MPETYRVRFTRQAVRDFEKLSPKLREKVEKLCKNILQTEPYGGKKLMGELRGSYSLRISYQDRLVYSIEEKTQTVFVERCKTHYGE